MTLLQANLYLGRLVSGRSPYEFEDLEEGLTALDGGFALVPKEGQENIVYMLLPIYLKNSGLFASGVIESVEVVFNPVDERIKRQAIWFYTNYGRFIELRDKGYFND